MLTKRHGVGNQNELFKAARGTVLYMDFPIEDTLTHTFTTLPSTDALKIIVRTTNNSGEYADKMVSMDNVSDFFETIMNRIHVLGGHSTRKFETFQSALWKHRDR
jgi:hypothetical protein